MSARQRSMIERALRDYLAAGGFPEAQELTTRDRRHLLQGYVDIVILNPGNRHGRIPTPSPRPCRTLTAPWPRPA